MANLLTLAMAYPLVRFANGEALLCAAYTQITDTLRLQALAGTAFLKDVAPDA